MIGIKHNRSNTAITACVRCEPSFNGANSFRLSYCDYCYCYIYFGGFLSSHPGT